ncbi:hypothetical protein PILCRDRAFT_501832 [Piloderma croceum F 1598]|uniref:Aminoglycoside phosphotransferase domain-containing protein n=1 Tax=Piloderma croceum (strain F 1598) TaxID=765440 RepID=A0A0C3BVP0_PILCF|nr:hypothetical protein PILCRDRAFT_501832 [Piloderma croceum F 1598]
MVASPAQPVAGSGVTSASIPTCNCDNWIDPQVDVTVAGVNWDALSTLACRLHKVNSADWGDQLNGSYNLVRFLHLHDQQNTTIVARIPLHPIDGWDSESSRDISNQIASEVATMQYIETYTKIPIPHIIHHSTDVDCPGVRSPYILMSKVDGEPLSSVWDTMEDAKRDAVLRQVVDILLELSSQRFDKIGALFNTGKATWHIQPMSFRIVDDPIVHHVISTMTYTSGTDYWIAIANANLESIISQNNFGCIPKDIPYAEAWFMRSLIPALYNPELDVPGFPLEHGDFHSQNIMVTDVESNNPRITAVIDWDLTTTVPTSSFAQYPLFIVDHPAWKDEEPLRARNIRDQSAFDKFMQEAELTRNPAGGQPLSRAFANCLGVYLFEQSLCSSDGSASVLLTQLFKHVFGDDVVETKLLSDYLLALMDKGLLKNKVERFQTERQVWCEALETLGEGLVSPDLSRSAFKALMLTHHDRFTVGESIEVVGY